MSTTSQQPARVQSDLIRLVRILQDDLRQRCEALEEAGAPLRAEYSEALAAQSTQETYQAWSGNYLNQVAVAWVLAGVFVRYLEDNDLIEERWLAGVDSRRGEPRERYTAFFRAHPELSDREYFHAVFDQVVKLPGCHDLFARDRNPLWKVGISGDGAKILREFFAEVDTNTGELIRTFAGDTRFLGDLYQNLSEEAQKKYALLQTPEFVEEFILDRTLEPALAEFGLENVKLIDPTCGSGHFLLGAFHRLFHRWENAGYSGQNASSGPGHNPRALARRAIEAVHGVDINPFAVAIARFRLVIAFVKACGLSRLREMPDVKVRVATGDSLLHGNTVCSARGWGVQELSDWLPDAFAAGDFEDAAQILSQRYEAVVGNPPYITARDKAHNNAVRSRYRTAYMKYSLAVPFKEKFWDLAVEGKGQQRAGFVGMITANSFMKREFGSRVIEEFFPRVDLTHVIDTSGAYIPGHGTPTVILLGRNRAPVSEKVRAVLGIRGEPLTPEDPAQGLVWRSVVELLERPGESSAFVSVTEFDRATFARHPWSIGGGGASELKDKIEQSAQICLGKLCDSIGFASFTGQDDVFAAPFGALARHAVPEEHIRGLVEGDTVRDHAIQPFEQALVPYDSSLDLCPLEKVPRIARFLWAYRNSLANIKTFGNKTKSEVGEPWWGWYRWVPSKYHTPFSVAFAFVATHNHFVLDRGGKVFNRTAPVIKLPNGATEDEHLALLGLLNSAAGNFWTKQVCHSKGGGGIGGGIASEAWEQFMEVTGSHVELFPVPPSRGEAIPFARQLDRLAVEHSTLDPAIFMPNTSPGQWNLAEKQPNQQEIRCRMVALQEELDWLSYQLYGILDPAPLATEPPPLQLGERAFEIAMARSEEETTWFSRHGSTPIKELPAHWPADYRATVEKRLDLIANNPEIALLEKPEHKRRWQQRPWEERLKEALATWLQDRIESTLQNSDHLQSVQQLADQLAHDSDFEQALQIHLGTNDYEAGESIYKLVQPQAVPYLAALRYSESGLRIRADWERTWELQRLEDAGESVANIPVPPKYGQKDFLRSEYWSLRGKLDVPKERFVSYPGAEREADGSLVVGWAGWNHLQRAQALASYALERRELDGWEKDRLIPLLAGLAELLPWLKQWHNQLDPDTGERMADYFEAFLQEQLRELSVTPSELATWRPVARMARSKK